jgi:hypothetical protein
MKEVDCNKMALSATASGRLVATLRRIEKTREKCTLVENEK